MPIKKLRTMSLELEVQGNLTRKELEANSTVWQEVLDVFREKIDRSDATLTVAQKPKVQVMQAPEEDAAPARKRR